jgi:hypothetical protein
MGAQLLGLAAGAIGGLLKIGRGKKLDRMADRIVIPEANYVRSPYAERQLAEAERLKNARMPGMAMVEQGIQGNQANATAGIQRNATSGSQALAMLGASQAQSNESMNQLGMKQGQYSMNMLNNYNAGLQGMTAEEDKIFQDKVRKQMMAMQEKAALRGAATANMGGGMNDIINMGFMYGQSKTGTTPDPTKK